MNLGKSLVQGKRVKLPFCLSILFSLLDVAPDLSTFRAHLTTHHGFELGKFHVVEEAVGAHLGRFDLSVGVFVDLGEEGDVCHLIWHLVYLVDHVLVLADGFVDSTGRIFPFFFSDAGITLVGKMTVV